MSDEHSLLIDAADRLFATSPDWAALEGSGVGSVLVSADLGGVGGCFKDAGSLIERAGWYAIDLPVAETILVRGLLARASSAVPQGALTLAVEARGGFVRNPDGTFAYSGHLLEVPWGSSAERILFASEQDGVLGIAIVATSAASNCRRVTNLADESRDELEFRLAPVNFVPPGSLHALQGGHALMELGALGRVAQIAGALERVLQLSIEHAGSRRQFGRTLSEFQVIQHQLAMLAEEVAAVKCASAAAYAAADLGDASFEIAAAKLRSCQAIGLATAIAHQVHGAMGCTREHALQRLTRRLWAWRSEYGNDRYWAELLGARACAAGAEQLWATVTARGQRITS